MNFTWWGDQSNPEPGESHLQQEASSIHIVLPLSGENLPRPSLNPRLASAYKFSNFTKDCAVKCKLVLGLQTLHKQFTKNRSKDTGD